MYQKVWTIGGYNKQEGEGVGTTQRVSYQQRDLEGDKATRRIPMDRTVVRAKPHRAHSFNCNALPEGGRGGVIGLSYYSTCTVNSGALQTFKIS